MKKVRVIGAGISGLLTAYYANRRGFDVEVFDIAREVGGKIQTLKSPHGLMETAANAVLADAEVEYVARDIGLELISTKTEARQRWIFRDGRLRRWPLGVRATFSVVKFFSRLKISHELVRPRPGELLQAWGERELGLEATENLISPACLGIFGVDARELSATLIFNYFFPERKRQKGALRGSVAPKEGLGELPRRLKEHLESRGVKFRLGQTPERAEGVTVIATDLSAAAGLLEKFGDTRGALLKEAPAVDLCSCNVFFEQAVVNGFGVLFPRGQGIEPLGVLVNSSIFPGRVEKGGSETWIFGGDTLNKNTQLITEAIQTTRQKLGATAGTLLEMNVNRWPKAIPLYGPRLEKILKALPASHNNIHLMGNYLGDIGLNRLFQRAKALVETF